MLVSVFNPPLKGDERHNLTDTSGSGYVFAASLFALGLASWQVLIALLAGICIVQLIANLVAKPSQQAAVPYPVICRLAFGVFGANIPAVIRGLIAVANAVFGGSAEYVALSLKSMGMENTFYWYVTVMIAIAFLFSFRLPKQPKYLHHDL